ncbi:MAG: AraC family transcriptional regulator [Gemmatimonadaceae bacterium]
MPSAPSARRRSERRPLEHIEFHRTKYGPELLVDCRWIHEMPAFILDRPHSLSFYDVTLVTHGRGAIWLDGIRQRVTPGRVICTTPGQVRDWHVRGLDGLCLFFPALFLEEFFQDASFLYRLPYFHTSGDASTFAMSQRAARALRRKFTMMRREVSHMRADSDHLLRAALYQTLMLLARAAPAATRDSERLVSPIPLRYRELVRQQLRTQHRVAAYAAELGVTPGHLNALAKRVLGRTAKQVIEDALVAEARRLLLYAHESAAGVGYRLGFEDPSYFTRFFRRVTGVTPRQFRKDNDSAHGPGATCTVA